ncbi:MAG: hypothetical protein CYPHOPRED_003200, partial [Cyphobasidiales sp. Tagirdzhanova-0007]
MQPWAPSSSSVDSGDAQTEHRNAKRRVTPANRKRAGASCDRCKQKKLRCEVGSGPSAAPADGTLTCEGCVRAGVECRHTLPRVQRLYGEKLRRSKEGPFDQRLSEALQDHQSVEQTATAAQSAPALLDVLTEAGVE